MAPGHIEWQGECKQVDVQECVWDGVKNAWVNNGGQAGLVELRGELVVEPPAQLEELLRNA